MCNMYEKMCCIVTETTLSLLTLQHSLCYVAGKMSVGQGRCFWQVPGTYSSAEMTAMVSSSNGVLTVPMRPNISRKPGQRKHACAE